MTGLQLLGLLNNLPREDLSKEILVDCNDGWHYSITSGVSTARVDEGRLDDDAHAPDHNVLTITVDV